MKFDARHAEIRCSFSGMLYAQPQGLSSGLRHGFNRAGARCDAAAGFQSCYDHG